MAIMNESSDILAEIRDLLRYIEKQQKASAFALSALHKRNGKKRAFASKLA